MLMTEFRYLFALCSCLFLLSCGGSGGGTIDQGVPSGTGTGDPQTGTVVVGSAAPDTAGFADLVSADKALFTEQSTRSLESDGEQIGLTAYELIRELGGSKNIESPDLYASNHPGTPHIYEALDADIGNHFVFAIHRDDDRDRDRTEITDRQRNEIKTYDKSEDAVLGYENETMFFTWKFRINDSMEVSKNFTHFFQLKAVGGPDSQPILTITGNESSSEDGMEIRHSSLTDFSRLGRISWNEVAGEWLEVYCRATFADNGQLRLIVARMSDGEILFDIDQSDIDLWRGESSDHFVRPKWGIYRSLRDVDNLRADEEKVRFANFVVSKATAK